MPKYTQKLTVQELKAAIEDGLPELAGHQIVEIRFKVGEFGSDNFGPGTPTVVGAEVDWEPKSKIKS